MSLRQKEFGRAESNGPTFTRRSLPLLLLSCCFLALLTLASAVSAQELPTWQTQVRMYGEAREWPSAMRILDAEITRTPKDLDLKAWRARVLTWAGRLQEAEQ